MSLNVSSLMFSLLIKVKIYFDSLSKNELRLTVKTARFSSVFLKGDFTEYNLLK